MSDSPPTPFLNTDGEPQLRPAVTSFLDILGFSQFCGGPDDIEKSGRMLKRITTAISDATAFVRAGLADLEKDVFSDGAAKFFSDNLVYALACERPDQIAHRCHLMIRCVQQYQLSMAISGFYIRGGVTHGPICITDQIVFGNALIESYKLESKASIVPRVIVSQHLRPALVAYFQEAANQGEGDCLSQDVDGWWFVNYLNAAVQDGQVDWELIQRHKESIIAALDSSQRHDVLPKFGWLSRYHNMFCYWRRHAAGYSDDYRIDRSDEKSVIHRWSEFDAPEPTG